MVADPLERHTSHIGDSDSQYIPRTARHGGTFHDTQSVIDYSEEWPPYRSMRRLWKRWRRGEMCTRPIRAHTRASISEPIAHIRARNIVSRSLPLALGPTARSCDAGVEGDQNICLHLSRRCGVDTTRPAQEKGTYLVDGELVLRAVGIVAGRVQPGVDDELLTAGSLIARPTVVFTAPLERRLKRRGENRTKGSKSETD